MLRIRTISIGLLVLFVLQGCGVTKRATRSPETDALLRAARAGNADTVRTLLAPPNVDLIGVNEHGNTPLIENRRQLVAFSIGQ